MFGALVLAIQHLKPGGYFMYHQVYQEIILHSTCSKIHKIYKYILISFDKISSNMKQYPYRLITGPEGSRRLRLTDYKKIGT